ncbi:hypothetical protein QCA50_006396 [Cerrena zonata]|uniref:Uncharacterized protein n=1 Tax=Cerrena zonata TaxID=2478898 RepID=A0AAW0GIL3_9APHY
MSGNRIERVYPRPVFDPTPEDQVRIVVLGSTAAGIYELATCPAFPRAKWDGESFPIAVYCRSEAEAARVYKVQSVVRTVETRSKEDIQAALVRSAIACALFMEGDESTIDCYASIFNKLNRPCIYLSWDDAYPHHAYYKWSKAVRAKTFVDGLIILIRKDKSDLPSSWTQLVDFPRPVIDMQSIAGELAQMSVGSSQAGVSRQVTASQAILSSGSSAAIPDTSPPSYSEGNALGLSTSLPTISHVPGDGDVFASIPIWALGHNVHSFPPNYAFVRVRDTSGRVIRSLKEIPSRTIPVPSLGRNADLLVDILGLPVATIVQIRNAFLNAREVEDNPCYAFIVEMVGHGMTLMEAGSIYNEIETTKEASRERLDF